MKTNKLLMILFSLSIFISSCNDLFRKNIDTVSEISVFPMMEFNEGYAIIWEKGKQWEEPGYHCSEVNLGDDDINESVVIDKSQLNVNNAGYYFISYTATNKYDYQKTFYRTVVVKDVSASNINIAGEYYTGFLPPNHNALMDVKNENNNENFYYASNIHTGNDVIPSLLINYGAGNYCIPRVWIEYAGGQYIDGNAVFNGSTISFDINFTSIEGVSFGTNTSWILNN